MRVVRDPDVGRRAGDLHHRWRVLWALVERGRSTLGLPVAGLAVVRDLLATPDRPHLARNRVDPAAGKSRSATDPDRSRDIARLDVPAGGRSWPNGECPIGAWMGCGVLEGICARSHG